MGNTQTAKPQVRELHLHALYINIPIPPQTLLDAGIVVSPITPCLFNNTAWISIVIDDLSKLETPMGSGFMTVPGMNGWMMKINVLVDCPSPPPPSLQTKEKKADKETQTTTMHGYQIITLDFEQTIGLSSRIKKKGAETTQKIDTYQSHFQIDVTHKKYNPASIVEGTLYEAHVVSKDSSPLVSVTNAKMIPMVNQEELNFVHFVVNRPHKFLLQKGTSKRTKRRTTKTKTIKKKDEKDEKYQDEMSTKKKKNECLPSNDDHSLVYASWRAYSCTSDNVMSRL